MGASSTCTCSPIAKNLDAGLKFRYLCVGASQLRICYIKVDESDRWEISSMSFTDLVIRYNFPGCTARAYKTLVLSIFVLPRRPGHISTTASYDRVKGLQ